MRCLIGVGSDLSVISTDGSALTRSNGNEWVINILGLVDAAVIGSEIWTASAGDVQLKRIGLDGVRIGDVPLPGTVSTGRWHTSAFVRAAVWQGETPWAVREDGPVALAAAEMAAPVTDGRWLTWRNGHASLWRSQGPALLDRAATRSVAESRSTRELWRVPLGESNHLVEVAALFDGRLIAVCLRERPAQGLRLLVLGVRDGARPRSKSAYRKAFMPPATSRPIACIVSSTTKSSRSGPTKISRSTRPRRRSIAITWSPT